MRNTRITRAALLIALAFLSFQTHALNILLTNDDGYDQHGINTLYLVLTNAGHNVTLVGPKTNQSGMGMRFNSAIFEPVEVVQIDPTHWYVDGSPVDSMQAGLDFILVDNPPDLVVSGANSGENVGPITSQSGTVGAAQKALQRGIPAIAVSVARDRDNPENTKTGAFFAGLFLVEVIDELIFEESERPRWCRWYPNVQICQAEVGSIQLPKGVGLNINHPAMETSQTAGTAFTRISTYTTVDFTIAEFPAGTGRSGAIIKFNPVPPTEQEKLEDTYLLEQNYITVSTLDPDINGNYFEEYRVKNTLRNLFP